MQLTKKSPLLPPQIAAKSISKEEIVLPFELALAAIDYLESIDVHILGWEGWIKSADGHVGHENAPQGCVSLETLTVEAAAKFCKKTINEDYRLWTQRNSKSPDELYFCIAIKEGRSFFHH